MLNYLPQTVTGSRHGPGPGTQPCRTGGPVSGTVTITAIRYRSYAAAARRVSDHHDHAMTRVSPLACHWYDRPTWHSNAPAVPGLVATVVTVRCQINQPADPEQGATAPRPAIRTARDRADQSPP